MRTTGEPLTSSEARVAILSRNETLRGLAAETIQILERGAQAGRDLEPLRAQAKDLCTAAAAHLAAEGRLLATALGDVIGWGPALRSQIEEDHQRQRVDIALALSALEPHGPASDRIVERVRALADALLVDLESEERYLLTADLDALSVDSRGG